MDELRPLSRVDGAEFSALTQLWALRVEATFEVGDGIMYLTPTDMRRLREWAREHERRGETAPVVRSIPVVVDGERSVDQMARIIDKARVSGPCRDLAAWASILTY